MKPGYRATKNKRYIKLTLNLELADGFAPIGNVAVITDAIHYVTDRAIKGLAEEFLP